MSLLVKDLAVARGGVALLEGINFALEPGNGLILRGPNGSGKTTLLRTVAGLQPALAGRVDLAPDSVAYAGHADGIKATLSVSENLTFWAGIYGQGDIGPALEQFDLIALADRPAQNLSAGQKRRLGLARLLVTGRPLWVLDEPTVSLDAASVALFAAAVRGHLDAGGMALMATHIDLGLSLDVLDVSRFQVRAGSAAVAGEFDEAFL